MKLKNLVDEDFVNYKKPSMFLIFPKCDFKCDKENGCAVCQNSALAKEPDKDIRIDTIIERYLNNSITRALVCGGLEPFDSWEELQCLIMNFRYYSPDDIVIYTGYNEEEIKDKVDWIKLYGPVVIKYGRFIPNKLPHLDKELGIKLASDNQYAIRYSDEYRII